MSVSRTVTQLVSVK